ncbi:MAG: ABC transporter permease [Hyphomicrobiales bacterium]|nr:ABC transporter permease [Hyphomicrobiales bacterium]MBV9517019.1 ABC transporter permease [Hyphomicrobiales bacterium]
MLETLHDSAAALLNFEMMSRYGSRLIDGVWITVQLVTLSVTLGFLIAYPVCLARMSRNKVLSGAAVSYVTFFRGTPLLCQLYLVYYGAGEIRPLLTDLGVWWLFREAFVCCIFAFSLNTAAYQAEIMRGALASVPKGQVEAAAALGLSKYRISRHIVWPQAFIVALRPFGNELISMIKSSALAAIVTLLDLMGETRFIFARTFDFLIYVYAAIIYLVIVEVIRRIWGLIERSCSRHLIVATRETQSRGQDESRISRARGHGLSHGGSPQSQRA